MMAGQTPSLTARWCAFTDKIGAISDIKMPMVGHNALLIPG
jgi:hypothetical protein